jgi:putative nucleotidyltransferase with HDIG domain
VISIVKDPGALVGPVHAQLLGTLLDEPLADGLTRADALFWGALLHDAAKPMTHAVGPDGRVTFIGHDTHGARLTRELFGRLRASTRLCQHVAALVEHHLRLGFLVHEPQPLARRTLYRYLRSCEPVEVDVSLLSVADRLATRGDNSEHSIEAHLSLAKAILPDALRWRTYGPPSAFLTGRELISELGLQPGPRIGELLEELAQAQYAGETTSPAQALELARTLTEHSQPG